MSPRQRKNKSSTWPCARFHYSLVRPMAEEARPSLLSRFSSELGMLVVLLALCTYFSIATIDRQYPVGEAAGRQLADRVLAQHDSPRVILAVENSNEGKAMVAAMQKAIEEAGGTIYAVAADPAAGRCSPAASRGRRRNARCRAGLAQRSALDSMAKRKAAAGRRERQHRRGRGAQPPLAAHGRVSC